MKKENMAVGLDDVLKELGIFGKYTVYNYAFLVIPCIISGFTGQAFNFEAMDINYRCEVPECELLNTTVWLENAIPKEKEEFSKCNVYKHNNDTSNMCSIEAFDKTIIQECDSYVYSDEDSVVKDFNLGCQNWKRTLVGTIHSLGYYIALPVTGLVSDKFGRTIAISLAAFLHGIFGITRSFSTNYNMFLILEFLETATGGGHSTSAYVMGMEMVWPSGRAFVNLMLHMCQTAGLVTASALAWWLQSWRSFLRIIFSLALIPSFYFIILKESPRWLISKGRYEEAIGVLRNAAKMNNIELPLNALNFNNNTQESYTTSKNKDTDESIKVQSNKPSLFWQIIKSKIIVIRLIICSYMWMSSSFIYYGMSINAVSLAGNKYLNFMLSSLVEIPANLVVFLLINRIGRKRFIFSTFLLSACMCISLSLLPKGQTTWTLILYLIGKCFSKMTYGCIYIYVSEVFPTTVRQTLFNFCSTMGRFGTTLAPLTPLLALYYKNLPAIFFGSVALIASMLTVILPETLNATLPNTIEEAVELSRRKK